MKILKIITILGVLLTIISCAKKQTLQTDFEDIKSAKIKANIYVSQEGKKEKLSAVLFAIPNEKYRMELSGTFGLGAASILWTKDGWSIVSPLEERYKKGNGNCISIPLYGSVDIHKFAALFFGKKEESISCNASILAIEYSENFTTILSGNDSLKIEIKNIEANPEFSNGVWNLNIPESYINVL